MIFTDMHARFLQEVKFINNAFVNVINRGGLNWATPELFNTISAVENVIDLNFINNSANLKDSFEHVI